MKKIIVLITTLIIALIAFTGCIELEPIETFPEGFAASLWEDNTIYFEDVIVEDVEVEEIIFEN